MKNRILSFIFFAVFLFNMSIFQVFAQGEGHDAYDFDFTKYDDKTAIVTYNENTGRFASFGRDRYICYKNVDFSEAAYFISMDMVTGQTGVNQVEIRIDSEKDNSCVTFSFPGYSWNEVQSQKLKLDRPITKGKHDIYVSMIAGYGDLAGLKFFPKVERIEDYSPEKLYSDIDDFDLRHKIIILSDLQILKDYETGIFNPKVPVTNDEFFGSFYGLYEGPEERLTKSDNVSEYIVNTLYSKGLIDYQYKDYNPEAYITDIEALKIVIKALGYEPLVNASGGNETAYINVAKELKLLKGINIDEALKKDEMTVLLYRAINTDCMETIGFGQTGSKDYSRGEKILEKNRKIICGEGIVELTPSGTLYVGTDVLDNTVIISGERFKAGRSHAVAYIGRMCDYWYDEETNELLALDSQTEELKVATYDGYQFEKMTETIISYKCPTGSAKNIKLDSNVKFVYNGMALDKSFVEADIQADTFSGSVTFVASGGGKDYDVVLIDEYKNIVLGSFTENKLTEKNSGAIVTTFDEDVSLSIYGSGGVSISKDDLKYGDYIVVYASVNSTGKKRIKIYSETSSVTGTLKNIDKYEKTAVIDEEIYSLAKEAIDDLTVSFTAEYIMNTYGEIVGYKIPEETDWILGLLTRIKNNDDEDGNSVVTVRIFVEDKNYNYIIAERVKIDGRIKKTFDDIESAMNRVSIHTPVRFKLNSESKISVIDTCIQDAKNAFDVLKKVSTSTSDYYYQGGLLIDKNLQRTVCPFYGTVFNYYANDGEVYSDMYSVTEFAGRNLANGGTPFTGDIYMIDEDGSIPNVFVCKNNLFRYYETPLVVSKKMAEYDEESDNIKITIEGFDTGGKKLIYPIESTLYDKNYNNYKNIVDSIGVGDVILLAQNMQEEPIDIEFIYSNEDRRRTAAPILTNSKHTQGGTLSTRYMWGLYDGRMGNFVKIKYQLNGEWITEYAKEVENVLYCSASEKDRISYITSEEIPIGSNVCIVWIGAAVKVMVVYE